MNVTVDLAIHAFELVAVCFWVGVSYNDIQWLKRGHADLTDAIRSHAEAVEEKFERLRNMVYEGFKRGAKE